MVGLEVQLDFDILATLYFFSLIVYILFHFISLAGCTVSLLEASAVEAFKEFVGKKYKENVGIDCVFYVAVPAHGAQAVL